MEDGRGLEPQNLDEAPGLEPGFLNRQNLNVRGRQPTLDLCQLVAKAFSIPTGDL